MHFNFQVISTSSKGHYSAQALPKYSTFSPHALPVPVYPLYLYIEGVCQQAVTQGQSREKRPYHILPLFNYIEPKSAQRSFEPFFLFCSLLITAVLNISLTLHYD